MSIFSTLSDDATTYLPGDETTLKYTSEAKSKPHTVSTETYDPTKQTAYPEHYDYCPSLVPCNHLSCDCLDCNTTTSCIYGQSYNTTCVPKFGIDCTVRCFYSLCLYNSFFQESPSHFQVLPCNISFSL